MKAGLSLNVFWQGTSKPLLCVDLMQLFHVQYTLDCTLHLFGLNFFPANCVSCYIYKNKLTERLHSK